MKYFLVLIFLVFSVSVAQSQVVTVDANKAIMSWIWTQSIGDPPTGFRMKCGNTTGVYNKLTDLPLTPLSVPVKNVITTSGNYFCAVFAFNTIGESGPSNEVNFIAGVAPSGSLVLTPPK